MRFLARGFVAFFSVLSVVGVGASASGATYYVSATGNDANSGTATGAAWRTVNKVNSVNFLAGDKVLFQGGASFSGNLYFDASDKGTQASPITISSYGTGRATINAGTGAGFLAYNTGGILLSNLNFVGSGATVNTKDGISFYADAAGNVKFSGITADSIDVSGFGNRGLVIGSWNSQTGFRDVRIANVSAHDNLQSGIASYAQVPFTHANIYIGHCAAYNNFGNPSATGNTGSGIVLGEVNGATVERCIAHDNGKNNFVQSEGPVGIWAYDATNIVLQFNESYFNHTSGGHDGGGFDLDSNVKNSVMQYNYSHDNDGSGYLLCVDSSNGGNVVRYNISQNDGRKNGYAGIHTYGNIQGAEIYNNTVFVSQTTGSPRAVWISTAAANVHLRNNIFYTTGGAALVDIAGGQSGWQCQGNCYFASSSFAILWNGVNYSSLDAWRTATGQEMLNGSKTGLAADPKLTAAGSGGTIGNADLLSTLSAYRTQAGSPVIDSAIALSANFGINPGAQDFYGTQTMQGSGYDIGASETVPVSQSSLLRLSVQSFSSGTFNLSAAGPIGATNVIEASTNFSTWTALTTVVNTSGTLQFSDANAKNFSRRFYRARVL